MTKFPIYIRQATSEGYIGMVNGGVCDLSYPTSHTRRGRVKENGTIAPTLMANQAELVTINIYKL